MSEPKRIQLRRTRGWRKPAGAVVVARPSRWGNPFHIGGSGPRWHVEGFGRIWTGLSSESEARRVSVDLFRQAYEWPRTYAMPQVLPLAGHDLCCWCPLDGPCHADVLLELANPPASPVGRTESGEV